MLGLSIFLNGENAWPDLEEGKHMILLGSGAPMIQVAVFEARLASGRPSVAIRLDLPDGRIVIAETSARLFCSAGRSILARFPDLFEGS